MPQQGKDAPAGLKHLRGNVGNTAFKRMSTDQTEKCSTTKMLSYGFY